MLCLEIFVISRGMHEIVSIMCVFHEYKYAFERMSKMLLQLKSKALYKLVYKTNTLFGSIVIQFNSV